MAFLTATSNSFGARWFDENWQPQFDSEAWAATLNYYMDLMTSYGPPGASTNGFNENLSLFQQGKCGMWIDATVAASFVTNPNDSTVADSVGFALAPDNGLGKRGNWLWAWSPGDPGGLRRHGCGEEVHRLGLPPRSTPRSWRPRKAGANVPPGTRTSLYENPAYLEAAPFAEMTLKSDQRRWTPTQPTVDPVPYTGVQFVAIPEFAGIATLVGQEFSAALAGQQSAAEALEKAAGPGHRRDGSRRLLGPVNTNAAHLR